MISYIKELGALNLRCTFLVFPDFFKTVAIVQGSYAPGAATVFLCLSIETIQSSHFIFRETAEARRTQYGIGG